VAQVIRTLEGPIAITECTIDSVTGMIGICGKTSVCPVHGNWQRINQVVEEALEGISLVEMIRTTPGCLTALDFGEVNGSPGEAGVS
jgi:DNA-binding IscR family transcriptional regulator